MKVAATIEARMGSSRLPGKVMLPINGQPVLYHIINRLRLSKEIDEIDVITSKKNENLIIKGFCEKINVNCFMGDELDLIRRILDSQKSKIVEPDLILQLTGDNPVLDPNLVDKVINFMKKKNCDYVDTSLDDSIILGLNLRCFKLSVLKEIDLMCKEKTMRSHGGYFIKKKKKFDLRQIKLKKEFFNPNIRLTLDEPLDFFVISEIFEELKDIKPIFKSEDIFNLYKRKPQIFKKNINVVQKKTNEG